MNAELCLQLAVLAVMAAAEHPPRQPGARS